MSPAAHWSPADYYRASRAARRACESRAEQLQIVGVLDSGEVARADSSVSAAASPVSSTSGALAAGESTGGGTCAVPLEVFEGGDRRALSVPPAPAANTSNSALAAGVGSEAAQPIETGLAEPVSAPAASAPLVPPSPPNQDALDIAAKEAAAVTAPTTEAALTRSSESSAFAASPHTRAPVAGLPQDLRDRSQEAV